MCNNFNMFSITVYCILDQPVPGPTSSLFYKYSLKCVIVLSYPLDLVAYKLLGDLVAYKLPLLGVTGQIKSK